MKQMIANPVERTRRFGLAVRAQQWWCDRFHIRYAARRMGSADGGLDGVVALRLGAKMKTFDVKHTPKHNGWLLLPVAQFAAGKPKCDIYVLVTGDDEYSFQFTGWAFAEQVFGTNIVTEDRNGWALPEPAYCLTQRHLAKEADFIAKFDVPDPRSVV